MRVKAKPKFRNAAGDFIPSVTTALGIINKPALIRWANRLGLEGIEMDKYKDELADVGILTHYLIVCRLREEVPDISEFTPEQEALAVPCFRKYLDWESKNPVIPVMVEERLVSERYQYGGTPDLYAICNKELVLVDFKTNAKGIYPEMVYQVSAYRQLFVEAGLGVSRATILRLGRTDPEGAEERILTDYEMNVGFEIFIRALEIYKLTTTGRLLGG